MFCRRNKTSFVNLSIIGVVSFIALIILAAYGWGSNIVAVFHAADLPISGMFILRVVGIFVAPLGAILGYL